MTYEPEHTGVGRALKWLLLAVIVIALIHIAIGYLLVTSN